MKKLTLFISFSALGIASALAQGPPPPNGGEVEDVSTVPIDDHLWLLFVLALVLAVFSFNFKKFSLLR